MVRQCIFPHCKSKHHLLRIPNVCKKALTHKGKKRLIRNEIETIKQKTFDETIKILEKNIDNFTYDPNNHTDFRTCINHYHPSVMLEESKRGSNTLLLGALPTINLSRASPKNKNNNHSMITENDRHDLLNSCSLKVSAPKKINRRDECMLKCNINRNNVHEEIMKKSIIII